MINYRLVIKCWESYGYNEGYGTGIRVLMLNVLDNTDDYMSVDHKAVWEALDGTKKFNCKQPVSRNQFRKI